MGNKTSRGDKKHSTWKYNWQTSDEGRVWDVNVLRLSEPRQYAPELRVRVVLAPFRKF